MRDDDIVPPSTATRALRMTVYSPCRGTRYGRARHDNVPSHCGFAPLTGRRQLRELLATSLAQRQRQHGYGDNEVVSSKSGWRLARRRSRCGNSKVVGLDSTAN